MVETHEIQYPQTTNLGVRGSNPFGRAILFNISLQHYKITNNRTASMRAFFAPAGMSFHTCRCDIKSPGRHRSSGSGR